MALLRNQETEPPGGLSILLLGRVPSLTTWPDSTRGIFRGSNDGTVTTLNGDPLGCEEGGHPAGGGGGTDGALRSILETEGLRLRKGEFRAQHHRAGRTWGLGALNSVHLTVSFSWRCWNG